ncbi:ureidoglycolate lyase [Fervidibacter sacchari]|uniref:Ureidoglycolate hydrolase n=1 Tax=Candidatus Fervidibacter sacchari TaxID=1448929 RepID=A0ABT2EPT2_9BACT|nr:ureidoglycolate lyase [Candidatus Fervidibacter sacchari]MCS3919979.1 ureidoglycolate hydrolase [Candidatus Fervidibacter sacchari]WKU16786.1 ureidoglycolate lyase [Candidatus Fervidibacter sacchari]
MRQVTLQCKPLDEENFAHFGRLVRNFALAVPKLEVGVVVRNQMRVVRNTKVEWVSAHYDGEQIIFPHEPVPTVFVVAPPSPLPTLESFRAFLSDGTIGVCLSVGVWHAMPIPVSCDHALYDNAQGSEWHNHTVEIHLPTELGGILIVELPRELRAKTACPLFNRQR